MGRGRAPAPGVRSTAARSIEIDFYYRGVRCREKLKMRPTPANLRYAERLRAEILRKIETGEFDYAEYFPDSAKAVPLSKVAGNAITVESALRHWMTIHGTGLQSSTRRDYERSVENTLIPAFGKIALNKLTRNDLKTWAAGLTITQKRLNNLLLPLRGTLADAMDDGVVERNVLFGWKPEIAERVKRDDDVDPLSLDEIRAVCGAAAGQIRNLFQFAVWTGLRTSELIELRWPDIDWRRGVARISRARVDGETKVPKTRAGRRDVKLLPPALEALKAQREFSALADAEVFLNPSTGAPYVDDQQVRNHWLRLLKTAGVRRRNAYQTRHTYASTMLTAGEDPAWVAAQMGHSDWGMIRRVYARWIPENRPDAGQKAAALWVADDAKTRSGTNDE